MRTSKIIYTDKDGKKHERYYPIIFSEALCKNEHDYKSVAMEMSCTEGGSETFVCKNCSHSYTKIYTESPGHRWRRYKPSKLPTCTEEGINYLRCENCSETTTTSIPMKDHKYVDATCLRPQYCSVCQTEFGNLGEHKWGRWKETYPPTCSSLGTEERTCGICGENETRGVDMLPHTWVDATCSKPKHCSECGFEADDVLADHNWSDWVLDEKTHKDSRQCTTCSATETRVHQFSYTSLGDGTYSVKANGNLSGDIIIPSSYKGKAVTQITKDGFDGRQIETVVIPNTVQIINYEAFAHCDNLTMVIIGDGVETIGDSAFYRCTNLESIVIGAGVTYCDRYAFLSCTNIKNVYYKGTKEKWDEIEYEDGFSSKPHLNATVYYYSETDPYPSTENTWHDVDGKPVVWCKHTAVTDKAIAPTCTTEGLTAGKHCKICSEVLVKQEIVPMLEHNYVKGVCTMCGKYNATPDEYFNFIERSDGWSIEARDVSNLPSEVVIPRTYNGTDVVHINQKAFEGASIESVIIPDTITIIGARVFRDCANLTEVEIPDSVTNISSYAFRDCTSLTSVVIGKNVDYISRYAFQGCSNLSITVAKGNTTYYVQDGCLIERGTEKVIFANQNSTIPSSARSVGEGAYYGHKYSAPIKIPINITDVESNAFGGEVVTVYVEATSKPEGWVDDWCDNNALIVWGYTEGDDSCSHSYSSWTTTTQATCLKNGMSERRCSICGRVETQIIPPLGHVSSDWIIDKEASIVEEGSKHKECLVCGEILETESIPKLLVEGYEQFNFSRMYDTRYSISPADKSISGDIVIPAEVNGMSIGGVGGFADCKNITSVVMPESVVLIHEGAFRGCENLTKVVIPDSVSRIGAYAFNGCTSLECLILGNGVQEIGEYALPNYLNRYYIFYRGSNEDFDKIMIAQGNGVRVTTIHYYSETEPHSVSLMHWRYVDGEVTVWKVSCLSGRHTYRSVVVPPTCTSVGYTVHTCRGCGATKTDTYTDPLGHNVVDGVCTRCNNGKKGVIYYDVSTAPNRVDKRFISNLGNKIPADIHLSSINTTPLAGEYIYYCSPTSFGECVFIYNNFVGGFSKVSEGISVPNVNGDNETYNVYRSNQANLGANGAITITIKGMGS